MVKIDGFHPQYIIDEKGQRKSVILSISRFEDLLEDIADLAALAERREEPTTSHDELIRELKKNELLSI